MKRSRRLETLVRLAAMAENTARTGLARANEDVVRKDRQQQQLESYEAEYGAAWLEAGRNGMSGLQAKGLSAFRDSLATTLEGHRASVRTATLQREEYARRWRGMRAQLQVFEDLAARARRAEDIERERKLQKAMDELAARPRRTD